MGYYGHRRRAMPKQNNPELVTRIESVAQRGISTMSDWERSFLGSLLDSAKKWGRLTAKQHDVFQRIEKKTDPAHQAAVKSWRASWTPSMAENLKFAANYYKANPPYFDQVAGRVLTDEDFIPSEKLYRKMVENKYVQRAMVNATTEPLYEVGTMVTVRDNKASRADNKLRGQDVLVLEVQESSTSATKGSRKYTVLAIGAPLPVTIEERWLKKSRR